MAAFTGTTSLLNESIDIIANSTRIETSSEIGTNGSNLASLPIYHEAPVWIVFVVLILLAIILIIGILGNSLLLAVLCKETKKSSTDIYVFSMAVIDMFSIFSSILYFVIVARSVWSKIGSDPLCKLIIYLQHCGYSMSAILVLSMGVDRYLRLFKYHIPNERLKIMARRVCILATIIPGTLSLVFIAHSHQNEFGYCVVNRDNSQITFAAYSVMFTIYLVLFLALGYIYVSIALLLKRRTKVDTVPSGLENNMHSVSCGHHTSKCNPREAERETPQPTTTRSNLGVRFFNLGLRSYIVTRRNMNTGSAKMQSTRSMVKAGQNFGRTTLTMVLITAIFFLGNVVPVIISALFNRKQRAAEFESLDALVVFASVLRYSRLAANPVLFIAGSAAVKNKICQMLSSSVGGFQ